ncbi:MAG TPA: metallophosphoesterase [Pseudomonadota bacterium]|nr:metallophosphoesterase [Pseudomonadota bacterium]
MRKTSFAVFSRLAVSGLLACACLSSCDDPDPDPFDAGVDASVDASTDDLSEAVDLVGNTSDLAHRKDYVTFVAIGDTGKGNSGQKMVADAVANKCKKDGCDFIQLLGDNIYDSGVSSVTDPQWQTKFEIPYKDIALPFYAALGNHDYGANGAGTDFGKAKWEILYTAASTKWKMPANHYRFQVEHADFFVLDTNLMMFGKELDTQKTSLEGWLKDSGTKWKFAFGHHPLKSNGPHGNAGMYDGVPLLGNHIKNFFEANVCGKVHFYFSGHDHSRQYLTETCSGTGLIVSGAGASTTELKGKNLFHFQMSALGFVYVVLDGNTMRFQFYDASGKLEDSYSKSK